MIQFISLAAYNNAVRPHRSKDDIIIEVGEKIDDKAI